MGKLLSNLGTNERWYERSIRTILYWGNAG